MAQSGKRFRDSSGGATRHRLARCHITQQPQGAEVPDISHAKILDQVALTFSDWKPLSHVEDPLHKDLSAVARVGDSLFLACDETASVERLRRLENGRFGDHRHFALDEFV